ncbi:immune inhibitor A [Streptomyces sp. B1866]|uniref:immune inhibitor A domain-containing protein n=1 Tax=Streptomyces sp. B1866 TaxID=3075431 RepID=UPI00288FFC47|nr:immune inhibitor A domain-containing protein [Streptomyces sp. B1866]MDT3399482.1 immune inhibitor A [Streptomyces sp. B1866]
MSRRRRARRLAAVATALAALGTTALGATEIGPAAFATAPAPAEAPSADRTGHGDPGAADAEHDLPGPFSARQAERREAALRDVLSGHARAERRGPSSVVRLGPRKYVELAREKTDQIFTILVEFGDTVDDTTTYDPDGPAGPLPAQVKYGGDPGPARNTIPEPDRSEDNSTAWQPDYDRQHFQDLYFSQARDKESLRKYYERQSSGRYSVDGEVSDWVKVEWNEARYGSNYCGSSNCPSAWDLIRDGVDRWAADQRAAGRTDAQIGADLARYDQWDRYDHDGDGEFNEPDGYIDHFQIVHAGEDESAGGGAQGEKALWAHRWYAYGTDAGRTGPAGNKAGGTQIGATGVWVGDYTMQPENGGLGVFAHEYGHDLGLPDEYDTTGRGESSVGFWSLMSSGSWLGRGGDTIGDLPGDMNAWDKLQLGWLDYASARAATRSRHTLGVAEYHTRRPQALVVTLPPKAVTTDVVPPAEGERQWWSGMGDDLKNTLTRTVDLTGRSSARLDLQGWWDIEKGYDYLYTEVSTDGGKNWTPVDGTANGAPLPRDAGDKPALTGSSGAYQKLSFPLDAYAGQRIGLRFRYATDGGVALKGFAADALTLTADGQPLLADGAEGGDNGWTAAGFSRIGASFTKDYPQYYLAENRQYVSYDRALRTGPYNFGWISDRPDWVEHFPYQNGLVIWQWDTSQPDNNVGVHPGSGQILPVDAHPEAHTWADGKVLRNRVLAYDAPFSRYPTQGFTLHKDGVATRIPAKRGVSVFDDHKGTYWNPANPTGGVKTTDTNTRIRIVHESPLGDTLTVQVGPSTT